MASIECTIHLIALQPNKNPKIIAELLSSSGSNAGSYMIKGRPHRWVHPPQKNNTEQLLAHEWDLFLLTDSGLQLSDAVTAVSSARVSIEVAIPKSQYEVLKFSIRSTREPIPDTPPLPSEWRKEGGIPQSAVDSEVDVSRKRRIGELRLDTQMTDFLSTTLPSAVRNKPVSLFNLFQYPKSDSSVHDAYMEGFKQKFGPAAGAGIRFMGPVKGGLAYQSEATGGEGGRKVENSWQDANLVQYDSIWHYAYMLSTDVYQELNQQKMEGLEDTCILCVSEVELV